MAFLARMTSRTLSTPSAGGCTPTAHTLPCARRVRRQTLDSAQRARAGDKTRTVSEGPTRTWTSAGCARTPGKETSKRKLALAPSAAGSSRAACCSSASSAKKRRERSADTRSAADARRSVSDADSICARQSASAHAPAPTAAPGRAPPRIWTARARPGLTPAPPPWRCKEAQRVSARCTQRRPAPAHRAARAPGPLHFHDGHVLVGLQVRDDVQHRLREGWRVSARCALRRWRCGAAHLQLRARFEQALDGQGV